MCILEKVWLWHFASVVLLPKTNNHSLFMKKKIRQIPIEGHPIECLTSAPHNLKAFKHQEFLKNCHSQNESNETQQLNAI